MLRNSRADDGRRAALRRYAPCLLGSHDMTQSIPASELCVVPESRSKPISSRGLRFLCRLGQGGMAEVHLADAAPANAAAPHLVVVKRMHPQHLDDAATVRMFLDEARLALCLS